MNRWQHGRYSSYGSGFTLIELMVVIGIVAILTSVLLPSVYRVQVKTRQTSCLQNLHAIHGGMMAYSLDHAGTLPKMKDVPNSTNYMDALVPYGLEDKDWLCPEADPDPPLKGSVNGKVLYYGYNHYGRGDGNTDDYYDTFAPEGGANAVPRVTAVASQRAIFMTDCDADQSPEDIGGIDRGTMNWPISHSFQKEAYIRHDGEYNALSLDGSTASHKGWKPNNEDWFILKRKD